MAQEYYEVHRKIIDIHIKNKILKFISQFPTIGKFYLLRKIWEKKLCIFWTNTQKRKQAAYLTSKLSRKSLIFLNQMWKYCTIREFNIEEAKILIKLCPQHFSSIRILILCNQRTSELQYSECQELCTYKSAMLGKVKLRGWVDRKWENTYFWNLTYLPLCISVYLYIYLHTQKQEINIYIICRQYIGAQHKQGCGRKIRHMGDLKHPGQFHKPIGTTKHLNIKTYFSRPQI